VGEPCELSEGQRVEVLPAGARHGRANLLGGSVLGSDPAVRSAGVGVGFAADSRTLRAPDVAVGDFGDGPGWARGAPPLAVEYADQGQDEADLRKKVAELLRAGSRHVWVVRLTGPRRVEVHGPDAPVRLAYPGEDLTAPGILQNPVPVTALYEPDAAQEVVLRNLLQRHGYRSLEHVVARSRAEGHEEGREEGRRAALRAVLAARGLDLPVEVEARLEGVRDAALLDRLIARAVSVESAGALLDGEGAAAQDGPAGDG
jgi:hypothetical protein